MPSTFLCLLLGFWLCLVLFLIARLVKRWRARRSSFRRRRSVAREGEPGFKNRRKPEWVRAEVIRLRALMPDDGCRTIASVFNRVHERSHAMTVSKSFVADLIRQNQLAILRARREVRRRKPRVMPRNLIWAMDLTYVRPEASGSAVPVLGIVDHGTRACVALRMLRTRTSVVLLRALADAVEEFGVPRTVRTDNEPVFCSRLFRFGLLVLGIRHERTEVMAPWQNGRVERFFGTLKSALRRWREVEPGALFGQRELDRFRFFYFVR